MTFCLVTRFIFQKEWDVDAGPDGMGCVTKEARAL